MEKLNEILKQSYEQNVITAKEYNNIEIYIVYRIVWETKQHYILYVVYDENSAIEICKKNNKNADKEYFYQKVKLI